MQTILSEFPEVSEKVSQASRRMDEFEGYDQPHGSRIAAVAEALAGAFNLASRDRFFLHQAALLHDLGEVIMERDYIRSPHVLRIEERLDMQRHPVIGEQETARMGLPRGVQLLVRWHHEWWNGSGYPDRLAFDQIPLAARILRVADSYASVTATRPFRIGWTIADAKKYLVEWAGIEFDPLIVKTFLTIGEAEPPRPRPTWSIGGEEKVALE